jgi:hypothetical protein
VIHALLAGNAVVLIHAAQTFFIVHSFESAFRLSVSQTGLVQDFMVEH